MGKHSAPRASRRAPAAPSTPTAAPSAALATHHHAADHHGAHHHGVHHRNAAVPAALVQTVAFGALAVVVAVVVLVWAGLGGREAVAVGAGLLVVGVVCFVLVRRAGLIAPDEEHAPHP